MHLMAVRGDIYNSTISRTGRLCGGDTSASQHTICYSNTNIARLHCKDLERQLFSIHPIDYPSIDFSSKYPCISSKKMADHIQSDCVQYYVRHISLLNLSHTITEVIHSTRLIRWFSHSSTEHCINT